ncbi:MAG: hypothetical protein ABIR77_08015 [Sphingomicrobium sp.]
MADRLSIQQVYSNDPQHIGQLLDPDCLIDWSQNRPHPELEKPDLGMTPKVDQGFGPLVDPSLDWRGCGFKHDGSADAPFPGDEIIARQFVKCPAGGYPRDVELRRKSLLGRLANAECALATRDLLTQLKEYLMIERRRLPPIGCSAGQGRTSACVRGADKSLP